MSGAKVVLAMLGAVLAIALIAVAAFLLTDDDKLLCVEGELQDNQLDAQGQFIPRTETFATIEEAEAFVCHRIPYPRDPGDLELERVVVTRTTNLGDLIEGTGAATVVQEYGYDFGSEHLTISATLPAISVDEPTPEGEHIALGGAEAVLFPGEYAMMVVWERDSFYITAKARMGYTLTYDTLVAVLDSVR